MCYMSHRSKQRDAEIRRSMMVLRHVRAVAGVAMLE